MPRLDLQQLAAACAAVRLTGRGGAGFPVTQKLTSLGGGRRTVVVNATESEPASRKDRVLLTRFPHLILDGAIVVADPIRARSLRLVVHDEPSAAALAVAIKERPNRTRSPS